MKQKRGPIGFVLIVAILWMAACSLVPFLTSPTTGPTTPEISRCGANPTSLCLASFGLDNAGNNMLISFFVPSSSTTDFYLKIQLDTDTYTYQCQVAENFASSVYCTGEKIPLGSSIDIGIYSSKGNALIAQGTFVVNAVALPTPIIVIPTTGTNEIPPVATLLTGTNETSTTATSLPAGTMIVTPPRIATKTPTPINPYPNPYPNP